MSNHDEYDFSGECFAARQMLRELPFVEPDDDGFDESANAWATFGNKYGVYQLVGNGEVTDLSTCGTFHHYMSCPTPERHGVDLAGNDFRGKSHLYPVYQHCHRAGCPLCYESWASRKALEDAARLEFAAKGGYDMKGVYHAPMGEIFHIVVSVPRELYHLSPAMMFKKAFAAAKARGVIGANMIWHGMRDNILRCWHESHHFHLLGFLADGYECRLCPTKHYKGSNVICDKIDCGGFERRTRDLYAKDGFIVKVLGKRISVYETVRYLLSHCTIQVGKPRFQPSRYFGSVACRKFKHPKVKRENLKCVICGSDCVRVHYRGSKKIVHERWREGYEKMPLVDVEEDGEPVIEIAEPIVWRKSWGDSYE